MLIGFSSPDFTASGTPLSALVFVSANLENQKGCDLSRGIEWWHHSCSQSETQPHPEWPEIIPLLRRKLQWNV
jgi:hypothetical protein